MANKQEMNLDWNKIVRDNKKAGFRDGVTVGREQNFQENFDAGYREGFKNAFLMGKYKGTLKALSLLNQETLANDDLLKDSRKGLCAMCRDNTLLDRTIDEITTQQTQDSEALLKCLQRKHNLNLCKK